MDTAKVRWALVVVPVILIGVLDLVTDHEWSDLVTAPVNTLLVPVLVLVLSIFYARRTYGQIDRLAGTVRDRNTMLERRNASLEALGRIGARIATAGPIDEIIADVLASARQLVRADGAMITLRADDGSERTVAALGDMAGGPGTTIHSAPLRRDDTEIGALSVRRRAPDVPLDADAAELLASLANAVAVALERDRLRRELRELAIHGERERIAREMHDGLAQVLGYVNTKALAIEELLSVERTSDARRQLAELAAAARSVYVDVREAIVGLNSPVALDRGLVGAIEDYALRYAEAAKIAASVTASPEARAVRLTPEAQAEVFSVLREALTNARKHARARRVAIDLATADGALVARVVDDGIGLRAAAAGGGDWPHYGMRMMRERAAAIGGVVGWSAAPGGGTSVDLRVPLGERMAVTP